MAFLLKAGKQIIGKSLKSQLLWAKSPVYFTHFQKPYSSSAEKSYEDLFAWVAADVHAYSRYTSLLARLCVHGPKMESETENSAESLSARNCVLRMLENLSRKDQMNLLLCFLANNPQVLKVLFVGSTSSSETITKTKLQITFPKMKNTIAKELKAAWVYKLSRFRFESEAGFVHCFVNVSDMEKETLVVFIQGDLLMVIGKLTSRSIYGETMRDVDNYVIRGLYAAFDLKQEPGDILATLSLPYKEFDLNQATAQIMEEGHELRISYPEVLEEVERPTCLHVKLKHLIHD